MIDFVTCGDHLIPEDELDTHCAFDFCECRPVMKPYLNGWFWVHRPSDENQLIDQAETIRETVSAQIWQGLEKQAVKHKIIPFPPGFKLSPWPQPADKNEPRSPEAHSE